MGGVIALRRRFGESRTSLAHRVDSELDRVLVAQPGARLDLADRRPAETDMGRRFEQLPVRLARPPVTQALEESGIDLNGRRR
jgi:hypothetical protein